ncbi:MAG: hypothetical protein AB4080_10470 [Trichodesmium sp.]
MNCTREGVRRQETGDRIKSAEAKKRLEGRKFNYISNIKSAWQRKCYKKPGL